MTKFDGVYALPNNMKCMENKNLADIRNLTAEILQYRPVVAPIFIFDPG
jgi:hypothetical protein